MDVNRLEQWLDVSGCAQHLPVTALLPPPPVHSCSHPAAQENFDPAERSVEWPFWMLDCP